MTGMTAFSEEPNDQRATCPSGSSGLAPGGLVEVTRPGPPGRGEVEATLNDLVARAVRGDQRATQELLATVRAMVLPYCRARLGRQQRVISSAEDVAQDICLAVLTALARYQVRGLSFRAFVYGIAAHKVTDAFRAAMRDRSEPMAEVDDEAVDHEGPEQQVLQAERSERLGRLLAVLSDRQREILMMRVGFGLSAAETAQVVRSTPGAIRVLQHRALARLRLELASDRPGNPDSAVSRGEDSLCEAALPPAVAANCHGKLTAIGSEKGDVGVGSRPHPTRSKMARNSAESVVRREDGGRRGQGQGPVIRIAGRSTSNHYIAANGSTVPRARPGNASGQAGSPQRDGITDRDEMGPSATARKAQPPSTGTGMFRQAE